MKARYAYPLMFLVPAAMASVVVAVLVAVAGAGILWIFVFGDGPWPESANTALMAVAVIALAVSLGGLQVLSYRFGRRQENHGGLRMTHAVIAIALAVFLPLVVLLHQWQVGNLGKNPVPPNNSSKPTPLRGAA